MEPCVVGELPGLYGRLKVGKMTEAEIVKTISEALEGSKYWRTTLVELIGIDRKTLHNYLAGKTHIRLDVLIKLCSYLNLKVELKENET